MKTSNFNQISWPFWMALLSFFLSLFISNAFYSRFDSYEVQKSGTTVHKMLRGDPGKYYRDGFEILKDTSEGLPWFLSGQHYRHMLAQGWWMGSFLNFKGNLSDYDSVVAPLGLGIGFFAIQSFIFILSALILFFALKGVFSERVRKIILVFLLFEPMILMFHSSYWTESLFMSFLNIVLSAIFLLYKNPEKLKYGALLGFSIFLAFLQRPVIFIYIVPLSALFLWKWKTSKLSILLANGIYFSGLIIVGLLNISKIGQFKILPTQADDGLLTYVAAPAVAKQEGYDDSEKWVWKEKEQIISDFSKEDKYKNISFEGVTPDTIENINAEIRLDFMSRLRSKAIHTIFMNPFQSAILLSRRMIRFGFYNPYFLWNYYSRSYGEEISRDYWNRIFPVRLAYSLFYYIPAVMIFIGFMRGRETDWVLIPVVTIFYFALLSFWIGDSRYAVPNLSPLIIMAAPVWALFFEKLRSKIPIKKFFGRNATS